ncbi:hypothetical protein HD806DRAFT_172258 [Xylariaceae sp. AK1471]|nr:hypothetical protein HD806DRAFT_172258 [Xylariaceae sp. AK1471]
MTIRDDDDDNINNHPYGNANTASLLQIHDCFLFRSALFSSLSLIPDVSFFSLIALLIPRRHLHVIAFASRAPHVVAHHSIDLAFTPISLCFQDTLVWNPESEQCCHDHSTTKAPRARAPAWPSPTIATSHTFLQKLSTYTSRGRTYSAATNFVHG